MKQVTYQSDFAAWAFQQASLLKSGQLQNLDIENLVEEIECMGRSEHRELANRLVLLIGHLLKWQYQPERRGNSWQRTIKTQRKDVLKLLKESPSLKKYFSDEEWLSDIWEDAVSFAISETGLAEKLFPTKPVWTIDEILTADWLPSEN